MSRVQIGGEHYATKDGVEHWDFTWEHRYNQFEYCVSKYVSRSRSKNGLEDLQKAMHHLTKYIQEVGPSVFTGRLAVEVRLWAYTGELNDTELEVLVKIHLGDLIGARVYLQELINNLLPPSRKSSTT